MHRDDLDVLTADLVSSSPGAGSNQAGSSQAGAADLEVGPPASARVTGDGGPSMSVAMFSGFRRAGVWTIPPKFSAIAIMGGGEIDLRHANLGAQQITIYAIAIMGGIEIIVPDDVIIREEGVAVMGSFADERKWKQRVPKPAAGAPVITITGVALMGSVEITRRASGPGKPDDEA